MSRYDYTVNAIGQRAARTQSGSAFNGTTTDTFGYNSRGEVTNAVNAQDSTFNRTYAYDPIGNRLSATEPNLTKNYLTNNLNQYTSVTSVPSVVQNPTYDLDGNMLTDGTGKNYTWDAENRLIQVTLPNNEIIRYSYDGGGRRIKREQINGTNAEATFYTYDGWNVIEEKIVSSTQGILNSKVYTWGLDLSRSPQGAGGVGGLLSIRSKTADSVDPTTAYVTYDGNGNVSELLAANGTIVAHYAYDAFGKEVSAIGSQAQENTYRFSTRSHDNSTQLIYYGQRHYSSSLGCWINRDVAYELGAELIRTQKIISLAGQNSYSFVFNNSLFWVDVDGRGAADVVIGIIAIDVAVPEPSDALWPKWVVYGVVIGVVVAADVIYDAVTDDDAEDSTKEKERVDAVPKTPPECKKKRCKPCIPPEGTKAYEIAPANSRIRGAHVGVDHVKIWGMNQVPLGSPNECACFWNFEESINGTLIPPPGAIPFPFTSAGAGGGVEYY